MRLRRTLTLALTAAVATAMLATPAWAGDDDDELDKLLDQAAAGSNLGGWADRMAEREPTFPYVEHHGYFRFRADFFHNGHLSTVIPGERNTGTSGIPAPLTENFINNDAGEGTEFAEGAKVVATANMRFRYSPTLHISESLRIHTTVDILDNLVMGSTPDFAGNLSRPDVPLSAFTAAQAPPSSGQNGFRDSIRVKEAYGEFRPAFLLRAGRMKSHWGMGILANGGDEIDDDFGDYTDRVLMLFKLYGVYVAGMWDFVYAGAVNDDPTNNFGQPKDLAIADDVNQWVLAIFQRPLSDQEKTERRRDVYEKFKPAFDWGLYTVFRRQDFDVTLESFKALQSGTATFDTIGLVPRDAWAVIPDLWLRYEQRFDFDSGIRIELEAAGIFGNVDNISDSPNVAPSAREIQQWGVALEVEYNWKQLNIGLDAGAASGDDAEGFGVLDRNTLAEQDGSPNSKVTAFKFDRDYQVDLLLFREVIGAVTNAVYIKPYISYDLFDTPEDSLGFRLDLLTAFAMEGAATPGNDSFLGFEADVSAFFYNKAGFRFDLEMGFLFPGAAFNFRPVETTNNRDAEFAFTLQGRLGIEF